MKTPAHRCETELAELNAEREKKGLPAFVLPTSAHVTPVQKLELVRAERVKLQHGLAQPAAAPVAKTHCPVVAAAAAKPTPAGSWSRDGERAALRAEAKTRAEHVAKYNALQSPRERAAYREAHRTELGLPRRN